jgi:hypothetical protein
MKMKTMEKSAIDSMLLELPEEMIQEVKDFIGYLLEKEEIENVGDGCPEIAKGDARTDTVDQTRHPGSPQKMHQPRRPGGMGEL